MKVYTFILSMIFLVLTLYCGYVKEHVIRTIIFGCQSILAFMLTIGIKLSEDIKRK